MLKIYDLSYINILKTESRVHISGFIRVIELLYDPHVKKQVIGSTYARCQQMSPILTTLEILSLSRKISPAVRSAKLIEDDTKI